MPALFFASGLLKIFLRYHLSFGRLLKAPVSSIIQGILVVWEFSSSVQGKVLPQKP